MSTTPSTSGPPTARGSGEGLERLRELTDTVLRLLEDTARDRDSPLPPGGPAAAGKAAAAVLPLSVAEAAPDPRAAFDELVRAYARWAVDLDHPGTVARMQCPPTAESVAAELATAALNQSLHAWESGPFALAVDRWVVETFTRLVGYGPEAGGTLTAGGSISNLMALLAARNSAFAAAVGESVFARGLGGRALRPVVLCTESAHFSIGRAAGVAGLGHEALVHVPTDAHGRMVPESAAKVLAALPEDALPVALVACAGTTDFGHVDPLHELADLAVQNGLWLHADAAYGGGVLFSKRLRSALDGIERADSITMDLHKFGWTPASSGLVLVRRAADLDFLSEQATSLNSADDREAGFHGRYDTSLQATRRVDALKIAVTLRSFGFDGLGARVDACHEQALHAAGRIRAEPRLQLADEPAISTVVFRYLPKDPHDADRVNSELRRRLMADGSVLLARTRVPAAGGERPVFLKLMLLNPATTAREIDRVLATVLATAARTEAGPAGT